MLNNKLHHYKQMKSLIFVVEVANFDVRQYEFREKFRKEVPFGYDQTHVYKKLDHGNMDITTMEHEMQMLNDSAALFEVTVPDFKQVKQCRKEIKLLKQLWDYIQSCSNNIRRLEENQMERNQCRNGNSDISKLQHFQSSFFRWTKNVKNSLKIFEVNVFVRKSDFYHPIRTIFSFSFG